jgi:hypothetical protein
MEGETTNEEEKIIGDYFANNDVPDDLLPYKEMFCAAAKPVSTPSQEEMESFFAENGIQKRRSRIIPIFLRTVAGIAASILIFLAGYQWSGTNMSPKTVTKIAYCDRIQHDTIEITVNKAINGKDQAYRAYKPNRTDKADLADNTDRADKANTATVQSTSTNPITATNDVDTTPHGIAFSNTDINAALHTCAAAQAEYEKEISKKKNTLMSYEGQ